MNRHQPERPTATSGESLAQRLRDIIDTEGEPWKRDAACREHPGPGWVPTDSRAERVALEHLGPICARCLAVDDCLAYALEDPAIVGVWAGTTSGDRKRLRRQHRAA